MSSPVWSPQLADPYASDTLDHRYEYYAWLRAESPVHLFSPSADPRQRLCLLTRHEHVRAAFRDDRLIREFGVPRYAGPSRPIGLPFDAMIADWMVYRDPPRHAVLRLPFENALRAQRSQLAPLIEDVVDSLLNSFRAGETFDLIPAFALPVPGLVISRLVGLDADIETFRSWMAAISAALECNNDHAAWSAGDRAVSELSAAIEAQIEAARADRGLSFLRHIIDAVEVPPSMTAKEMVSNLLLLLFAGYETTLNLIANTAMCLLRDRTQLDRVLGSPSLVGRAVDECLRYEAPVQMTYRGTAEPLMLWGVAVPAGTRIALVIGSAGRDPTLHENPDRFDLMRVRSGHLAFGHEKHLCPGAALGRMEAEISIQRLLARFPGCRLGGDELCWKPSMTYRALRRLDVEL